MVFADLIFLCATELCGVLVPFLARIPTVFVFACFLEIYHFGHVALLIALQSSLKSGLTSMINLARAFLGVSKYWAKFCNQMASIKLLFALDLSYGVHPIFHGSLATHRNHCAGFCAVAVSGDCSSQDPDRLFARGVPCSGRSWYRRSCTGDFPVNSTGWACYFAWRFSLLDHYGWLFGLSLVWGGTVFIGASDLLGSRGGPHVGCEDYGSEHWGSHGFLGQSLADHIACFCGHGRALHPARTLKYQLSRDATKAGTSEIVSNR